ncbi:hypothetical protein GCM10027592_27770 [Spirosoma flavus]
MKKYLAFLLLVGFLATQANAAPITTHKPKGEKVTLEQQLANYVSYPDALKPTRKSGIVVVQFRINSDSEICRVEVFSQNEQLNNELISQLTGVKLEGIQNNLSEFAQQVHTVRLRFKAR